jgi:CRISPR-associated protein (TIGR02584 family)
MKHLLLCVAGGTPQIITETLYALAVKGEQRVDEIRVITTLEGRKKIRETLLAGPTGLFPKFLNDYPGVGKIQFDEAMLYLLTNKDTGIPDARDPDEIRLHDILTSKDNERAANQIAEIVRHLTQLDDLQIHASVAGGRKTMGLYLQSAMQLFGRDGDRMSHVLVNNEIEGKARNFFYPTPNPEALLNFKNEPLMGGQRELTTADAEVYLANIPFIRLRGTGSKWLLERSTATYSETVDAAQADLKFLESAHELRFDLARNLVKAADRQTKLAFREFFLFALFAWFRKNSIGTGGFIALNKINREHLEPVCRMISRARGEEVGFEDFGTLPRADFISTFELSTMRQKLTARKQESYRKLNKPSPPEGVTTSVAEAREKIVDTFRQVLGKITPKFTHSGMDKFDVLRKGEKESYIFGLNVRPERIIFE